MEKIIIFKDGNKYKATTEQNYYSKIWDGLKVHDCNGFETAEEIKNYYIKYCNIKSENIKIIDN